MRRGEPLLQAGQLVVDPDEVRGELRRVARNLADTSEMGTPGQRAAEVLASAPVEVGSLSGPALDGDRQAIARAALRLELDADALSNLLELALQPFLWEASSQLSALTDLDRWERGYCPVCGAWPGLAELVGPEKRRVLRCVRCGTAWSWLILLCPYCGNDDHRTLRMLEEEDGARRVDVCEKCHGYLKAVPSYTSVSGPRLLAEDAATLHLDVLATDAGYKRPGDVDVTSAGVPRSVREGVAFTPEAGA